MDVWSVFGWVVAATPICLLWGLALTDIHRREDLRGERAAAWALVVLVPLVGALIYLARRPSRSPGTQVLRWGEGSSARPVGPQQAQRLALLVELRDRGLLSAGQFEIEQATVLEQHVFPAGPLVPRVGARETA